jgi:hypothetical protein
LPAAFRGALGHTLRAVSEERLNPMRAFGTAFQTLFADHHIFEEGWFVPKPFVIWVTTTSTKIYVEITLFGEAGYWRDDVAEAALRIMVPKGSGGQGGISVASGSPVKRAWKLEDIYWREMGAYPIPKAKRIFILATKTPIITSAQSLIRPSIDNLLFTIFARVSGVARWNGVRLDADWSFEKIRELVARINHSSLLPPRISVVSRKSRSYGQMTRLETGLHLELKIDDYPDALWPGFVLGTLAHAGYDTSQGFGRIIIADP